MRNDSIRRACRLILSTGTALVFAALVSGCADPCAELQPICDDCQDPGHRAACEQAVDSQIDDQCELDIENYRQICH